MIVEKLELENFRGFEQAEIKFDKRLNVFIGGNGAGKTSILEAIVDCLVYVLEPIVDENLHKISSKDVNYNHTFTVTNISVHDPEISKNHHFYIQSSYGDTQQSSIYSDDNLDSSLALISILEDYTKDKTNSLPIIKFYPTNRNATAYTERKEKKIYPIAQIETWANVQHNNASYSKFLNWFFENETKELRFKRDQEDFKVELPYLKAVRFVINKAFQKLHKKDFIVKSNQFKRTGSNDLIPTIVLQNKATKQELDINSLSDGEKTILTLISDIAYNLSIANPEGKTTEEILGSKGIVLIDEIDAHLHPTWQREIVPLLLDLFPSIQFFVTTHSPQTIASIKSEQVFICDNFEVSQLEFKTKGLDSNTILRHVFNSTDRPKEYQVLLSKFDDLIEAQAPIKEIEAVLSEITKKEKEDRQLDISQLESELELRLEAYKFDLEHEENN
ncbi:MAG: Putative ATP-binding protein involved in virulence [uncultured Aureispira sp.]|uniref:ATP-binding protein involved in virulence n=1 Tax=uncultured Aureispira sp. TaxID=1331704 RepID=A0A6S6SGE6_9BACT|nr:MAG: Putative ATP-binding protein involved in virulence [uncultured Aureispira sp.]